MSRKQPNPVSPVESKGWKRPSPTGVVSKKYYWNISFLHDSEQTAYGFRSFSTDAPVFRLADYKRFEEVTAPSKVGVILSISYLGEMTEEEWRGEE